MSTSGFNSSQEGIKDFELQGLQLLQSSHSGFDTCSRLHCALGRCHQHLLVEAAPASLAGASTSSWQAPYPGEDWQPPAVALPGQLCCPWIMYLCIYTVATVMQIFVGNRLSPVRSGSALLLQCLSGSALLLQQGFGLVFSDSSIMKGWSWDLGQSDHYSSFCVFITIHHYNLLWQL